MKLKPGEQYIKFNITAVPISVSGEGHPHVTSPILEAEERRGRALHLADESCARCTQKIIRTVRDVGGLQIVRGGTNAQRLAEMIEVVVAQRNAAPCGEPGHVSRRGVLRIIEANRARLIVKSPASTFKADYAKGTEAVAASGEAPLLRAKSKTGEQVVSHATLLDDLKRKLALKSVMGKAEDEDYRRLRSVEKHSAFDKAAGRCTDESEASEIDSWTSLYGDDSEAGCDDSEKDRAGRCPGDEDYDFSTRGSTPRTPRPKPGRP